MTLQKGLTVTIFQISDFNVSNGARQSGVLSPKLFAIYIDNLSQDLAQL